MWIRTEPSGRSANGSGGTEGIAESAAQRFYSDGQTGDVFKIACWGSGGGIQ